MKVLFDAHWWVDGPPSGRNVVRSVVRVWNREYPDDELTIRVPSAHRDHVAESLEDGRIRIETYSPLLRIHATAAMSVRADRRNQDAVVTQNFCPLLGSSVKSVLVHDAMFVEHPEWFTGLERRYLSVIRPTLRRADLVFSTSATETHRIERLWPELRGRCVAVGLGIPENVTMAAPRRPTLPIEVDTPFILSVGRLNVRKNLARLIKAFEIFSKSDESHHLLVVGDPDGATENLRLSPETARRVHFLGFVDDGGLRWLYQEASLFTFPSLDEGFGLPILEAAHEGTVIAASDIPVFRELGLVDVFFDPTRVESIAQALAEATAMKPRANSDVSFAWERTVGAMRSAIQELVQAKGPAPCH